MECTLYLTDSCNMLCSYCYEGENKEKSFMSEEVLESAIDYMIKNNPTDDRIDLLFLGGEPLLNKKIMYAAISIINNRYNEYKHLFSYQITTNGSLIDKNVISFFKENNFDVSISIDGNIETHNINRKSISGKDIYNKIIKNMNWMLEVGLDLTVRMTVTLNNVSYLYENVTYFYNMGIRHVNLGLDQLASWSEKEMKVFDEQLTMLENLYLNYVTNDPTKILNIFDYKLASIVFKKTQKYCSAGTKEHYIVNSKGEIYPCGYVSNLKEWCLGNVKNGLNSELFLFKVGENIKREASCSGCEISPSCCGAKCGFLNYRLTGYLNVNSFVTCQLHKIVYTHLLHVAEVLYKRNNIRIVSMLEAAKTNGIDLTDAMIKIIDKYEEK